MPSEGIQKHARALELDKILKLLASRTACDDAARIAENLVPSTSPDEVGRLLQETDDAYVMMARFGAPPFGGLTDVTNSLRRAQAGGMLTMAELLRVSGLLRTLRAVVEWRSKSEGVKSCLDDRFSMLMPNQYLENRINQAILSEEEMADGASQALSAIRRKIRNASSKAREVLDRMIRSASYQKYLQDPIVTIRGGRFVVPVRAEYRNEVPGLVHDTSASGSTLFVEPLSAVELNNQVRVLQSEEKKEIERILSELSAEAGGFADTILRGYHTAVELNVIFAKADLAYRMKATMPKVNDRGRIVLKKARHPLIDPKAVVPTDIELGTRFDTLVITGPNTGGKTVSLKTVGLLTLMAMCGLMIPTAEESEISVFQQVLADIGDEQSIEQSLSTFSAHMTNIIQIMKQAGPGSLILLDELGAGTDPVEGAALAEAILEALRAKGARIAATTHYAELKAYALQTQGVENASCEFNVETLRPTYRLLIGVPGRSNAFAISLRLGLENPVVERAKDLVSQENTRFEDVVQTLESSRQKLEGEREEARQARFRAEEMRRQAEEKLEQVQKEADGELEKAREKAAQLVARTRAQADSILNELEEVKKQRNKALTAEQKARMNAGMRELENGADPVREKGNGDYVLPRPLKAGDAVLIFDLDKKGTVIRPPEGDSGEALIQAGILQTRVPVSNLRLLREKPQRAPVGRVTRNVTSRATAKVTTECDLRGQAADEAVMNLDRFLDSALLSGVDQLTVIHGKGTGTLRAAVQQHLKNHPSVRSYRLGTFGEGESGVTIVELK
ncbi:Endonuclease MutS2 [Caprobacter fermentans]|uniref:Endonuclease MutS2 n=1 Tax=Caproicibacter fermentans TaxID=2576756 RepID=A0A6N8HXM6_9FIRM|nr:endonuclease MutS2 [Caproicibacter fermentans]MVB10601.1 Endonuclease MutS2 [Caproicibacter fermentans]QNK41628.1 endonuclease MutS2 [Caproicibacter fermentans]